MQNSYLGEGAIDIYFGFSNLCRDTILNLNHRLLRFFLKRKTQFSIFPFIFLSHTFFTNSFILLLTQSHPHTYNCSLPLKLLALFPKYLLTITLTFSNAILVSLSVSVTSSYFSVNHSLFKTPFHTGAISFNYITLSFSVSLDNSFTKVSHSPIPIKSSLFLTQSLLVIYCDARIHLFSLSLTIFHSFTLSLIELFTLSRYNSILSQSLSYTKAAH